MMKKTKTILSALCIGLLALVAVSAGARTAGYTKLNVKGRVQLEIPSDWTINDSEQRRRIKEQAEKLTSVPSIHTASLAAQSYPAPSRAIVRVSFIPMAPPLTQADVQNEVRSNKQQVLRDLADVWREESPTMWAALAKNGVKQVGRPHFAVEPIGGKIALIISYRRTSIGNPSETMRVTQYHVPLGAEKALITLSYIDSDPLARAAHNRIKSSIRIR